MSVEKKGRKWYIRGKIKKDDGTYYENRRLARGCTGKKEAEEYDRKFKAISRYSSFVRLFNI